MSLLKNAFFFLTGAAVGYLCYVSKDVEKSALPDQNGELLPPEQNSMTSTTRAYQYNTQPSITDVEV